MRKDVRNDCEITLCEDEYEITLCEDEYEILHELRETVMNSSELPEAFHVELPYCLNHPLLEHLFTGFVLKL